MNKEEFLRTLREVLAGEVPQNIIEENIRYYDAYITDEVRKGRNEEEVIEELGGARVIARTIIDVAEAGGDAGSESPYEDAYQESAYRGQNTAGESYEGYYGQEDMEGNRRTSFHVYDLNKWYWKLLLVVIVIAVVFLLLSLVTGLVTLFWPLLVVGMIVWIISGRRR